MNVKCHVTGSWYAYSAELTNIPIKEAITEGFEADAKISDGVKFISFDYKSNDPYTYVFTPSPDDRVMIDITLRQEYWHW